MCKNKKDKDKKDVKDKDKQNSKEDKDTRKNIKMHMIKNKMMILL